LQPLAPVNLPDGRGKTRRKRRHDPIQLAKLIGDRGDPEGLGNAAGC
jgi:hypothetical protein